MLILHGPPQGTRRTMGLANHKFRNVSVVFGVLEDSGLAPNAPCHPQQLHRLLWVLMWYIGVVWCIGGQCGVIKTHSKVVLRLVLWSVPALVLHADSELIHCT